MFERDQAEGLRSLFSRQRPEVTIVFGGGLEQSALAAASALRLAEEHANVLLIDGTSGGLAQTFDCALRYELNHVLAGDRPLFAVMRQISSRLRLLPAMRGLERLAHLDRQTSQRLKAEFRDNFAGVGQAVDAIVINAKTYGAHHALLAFARDARLVVSLADGSEGLTGAYQELKALRRAVAFDAVDVAQQAPASAFARDCLHSLACASERFLGVAVRPLTARLSEEIEGAQALIHTSARHPGRSTSQHQPREQYSVALC